MIHAGAIREQHFDHEAHDDDGEVSGVFERLPSFDVAVGVRHHLQADHDPAAVYALPFLVLGRERVPYPQCYYLGTRFVMGMIASDDWEDEMRADGLPEAMIVKCRSYIEEHAIR